MTAVNIFFIVCGLIALVGGVSTIAARNPIRGAVGLLTTIVAMAGLFLLLEAQFLAAVQLLVYAGAVVVLFVFAMMLLGPDARGARRQQTKTRIARAVAGTLMGLGAVFVLGLLVSQDEPRPFPPVTPGHGDVTALGKQLFTVGVFPFELATVLLVVAVVGAIAVARSQSGRPPRSREAGATRRLFVGPVHPRDAARSPGKETAK